MAKSKRPPKDALEALCLTHTTKEIASFYHASEQTVRKWLRTYGIDKHRVLKPRAYKKGHKPRIKFKRDTTSSHCVAMLGDKKRCYLKEARALLDGKYTIGKNQCVKLKDRLEPGEIIGDYSL